MADRFEQLKMKYQSVLNFIQAQNVQLQNLNLQGDKLLIRATAPSESVKNRVWDQIKLVDPNYQDLVVDITAPLAAAAAAGAGSASSSGVTALRTYTVAPGDSLSRISKQFYGDPNKYMKIFEANRDKMPDPDHVRVGTQLVIP
jgi:nucleoid-associated protein YgaU